MTLKNCRRSVESIEGDVGSHSFARQNTQNFHHPFLIVHSIFSASWNANILISLYMFVFFPRVLTWFCHVVPPNRHTPHAVSSFLRHKPQPTLRSSSWWCRKYFLKKGKHLWTWHASAGICWSHLLELLSSFLPQLNSFSMKLSISWGDSLLACNPPGRSSGGFFVVQWLVLQPIPSS